MDEYEDHFRIATTTQWPLSNNLIILDDEMKLSAMLEGIAYGEEIKSVRFMGDRAYVVTFRVIDPFFVIDVGDPTNPEILGELKIPGYSEYLHPLDPNHIVGFGRQVEYGRELGLKISLFDVTDVNAPVELQTEVIGDSGTDSDVLDDHKALLFSKAKNIMAFPITVVERTGYSCCRYEYVFQGAYFYYIDESGFTKEGEDTHYADDVFPTRYFCSGDDSIRRIIYIGDYYYTISDSKIKAIEMGSYLDGGEVILE